MKAEYTTPKAMIVSMNVEEEIMEAGATFTNDSVGDTPE